MPQRGPPAESVNGASPRRRLHAAKLGAAYAYRHSASAPMSPPAAAAGVAEAPSPARRVRAKARRLPPILVTLFIIGLAFPVESSVYVGSLRLAPYRLVLIAALLPCLLQVLQGRAGRFGLADGLLALHALWAAVALLHWGGLAGAWEPAGVYVVESLGAYLIARAYIRSAAEYEAALRLMFLILMLILPFAVFESMTGQSLIHDAFRQITGDPPLQGPEPRLGLDRAFGPFEHPILFGFFSAGLLAGAYYVLGRGRSGARALARLGAIALATFASLSSGPYLAFVAQAGLIAWDRVTRRLRGRWVVLASGLASGWVLVDVLSNRTPFHVFVWYLTLNRESAYNRILIWNLGTAEVARHPIFGIGLGEWQRPGWMGSSVDNFWLLEAMRYGLPGVLLLCLSILLLAVRIGRSTTLDDSARLCRSAWLVTLIGLSIAGATVHFWNALFCLFFFLIGAGAWLTDARATTVAGPAR